MRASWGDARGRVPHIAVLVALLVALLGSAALARAATIYFDESGPRALVGPQLTGDARVGGTLTCARGTWDDSDREPYDVEYRWYGRAEVPIGDGATHVVDAADVDDELSCVVIARDGWREGGAGSRSQYIDAPRNLNVPTLAGDDRVGGALTCTRGTWDDRGLATAYGVEFAWTRDDEPIEDATGPAYVVTAADVGKQLNCVAIAAGSGFATSGPAFPDGPRNHIAPQVGGDARAGGTLTCAPGGWDGSYAFTYAWLRDGEPIALATAASHLAGPQDAGHDLSCRVTAAGLTVAESAPTRVRVPGATLAPQITGDLRVGGTLSCDTGRWDAAYSFTYAWSRGGSEATRANAVADIGEALTCTVTAQGLTPATSAPVLPTAPIVRAAPRADGDARLNRTLTCDSGSWDGSYALAIEWTRGVEIAGTGATYDVSAADVGQPLRCAVTAAGLTRAESRTAFVPSPRNLVAPAITGEQTLTCGRGSWDEPVGKPYAHTYAWTANGAPAGDQRTLTAASGTTYTCTVTVAGTQATSAPFTAGTPAPPVITGAPRLGATLTCEGSGAAYAWQRDSQPLSTGPTRVVAAEDLGHELRCTADGTSFSAAVTPAAPVALAPPEISGAPRLGRTLTCTPGTWDGDYTLTREWTTRVVSAADLGKPLSCTVSAGGVSATAAEVTPTAPVNRTAPALTGDPRVGGTLTCGSGTWDDDYTLATRWVRETTAVGTGVTYVAGADDIGKALRCDVLAGEVAAASREVVVRAPSATGKPIVSGTPRIKGALTCAPGDWDGSYAYGFRWLSETGTLLGTGATYAPVAPGELRCEVTAAGLATALSDRITVTEPRSLTPPSVEGSQTVGSTLTCRPGGWDADNYAFSYRWLLAGDEVGTGATHVIAATGELTCEVKAESRTTVLSGPVGVETPRVLTPPAISGTPILRGTLQCTSGTWDGAYALTYRWYRDGVEIAGQAGTTYAVLRSDFETEIGCGVTAAGLSESDSETVRVEPPHTTGVRIVGALHPGRAVTCDPGRWNDRADARYHLTYQWFHDVERLDPVPGGDAQTYVLKGDDVDHSMTCVVTAEGEFSERAENRRVRWEDIQVFLKPDADSVQPGQANAYTLTVRNPNPLPATENELEIGLPAGFAFVPGSVTGFTTQNPAVSSNGRRLTWSGSFAVPARGEISLRIAVTGATDVGHHRADAWAYSWDSSFSEQNVNQGARITVEGPQPACTITGTAGDDVLVGTPGDDVICGLDGDDRLYGMGGDDILLGGDGNDLLDGGEGADVMRGGSGLDTVTYANRTTPVWVTIGKPFPDGTPATGGDGEPGTPAEGDDVDGDIEIVRGGRGDDVLVGTGGDEELYGGPGNDELRGGGGDDLLDGGPGDDFLRAYDGRASDLLCGAGVDTFERDAFDRVSACEIEFWVPVIG